MKRLCFSTLFLCLFTFNSYSQSECYHNICLGDEVHLTQENRIGKVTSFKFGKIWVNHPYGLYKNYELENVGHEVSSFEDIQKNDIVFRKSYQQVVKITRSFSNGFFEFTNYFDKRNPDRKYSDHYENLLKQVESINDLKVGDHVVSKDSKKPGTILFLFEEDRLVYLERGTRFMSHADKVKKYEEVNCFNDICVGEEVSYTEKGFLLKVVKIHSLRKDKPYEVKAAAYTHNEKTFFASRDKLYKEVEEYEGLVVGMQVLDLLKMEVVKVENIFANGFVTASSLSSLDNRMKKKLNLQRRFISLPVAEYEGFRVNDIVGSFFGQATIKQLFKNGYAHLYSQKASYQLVHTRDLTK
tara:strand:+ start:130458 stop:131522 length:1065 start_codon:yes stop_codon:yes gene_type:complete